MKEPWEQVKPWLYLASPGSVGRVRDLLPLSGLTFAAWMNGETMGDSDAVFEQFWHGFQLPEYFGWNFPALSDCLRDLRWLPADQYVLFIEKSDQILRDEVEARFDFFGSLLRAGEKWGRLRGREDVERVKFLVVLECDEREVQGMREIITNAVDSAC
ncbi:barstar family protein [Streptomyces sp. VTCC 41912]|uniref:barstar family protein n=1 Tax=Streptomyces sp. VTCC 41912 TaxID=3383243 RepID=UPI00389683B1